MRCHFVVVDGERVFIPMCYPSLHQEDAWACCCRDEREVKMASTEAKQRLHDAEKEIYRLERLLWKLTKHKSFSPVKK
jgi:hypothetical protein